MYFFTADEHYFHKNIIKYCSRPFSSVEEMNVTLISNHNEVVRKRDVVVHVGDFSFGTWEETSEIIRQLNGRHVFIQGDHDSWMKKARKEVYLDIIQIWEKIFRGQWIIACHYPMLSWPRSYHGSWQVFGHVHGRLSLDKLGRQWDVGVDNNNFYPVSFTQLEKKIMERR